MAERPQERVGADTVRLWARKLPLRDPWANSVLRAAANYAMDGPEAWMATDTLAEDTCLSLATVRRTLTRLESLGVIARFKRWRDEDGRINEEKRGRQTTDRIVFVLELDIAALDRRTQAIADEKAAQRSLAQPDREEREQHRPEISPTSQVGLNDEIENEASNTGIGQNDGESYLAGSPAQVALEESFLEPKKDSPQKPPERSGGLSSEPTDQAESESGADPPGLAEFTAAYPIPSNKPAQVRALWLALDAEGRARNIRGAIGARRYRETTKPKPSLPAPEQFIRNGAAEAYLAHAPDPSPQAPQGPQWVPIESLEGRALSTLHRIARAPQPLSHARPSGEFYLLKIPLDERGMAFAAAPDQRQWITITETAKIAAWCEFLQAAIGRAPATGNGLSVPWPWPPKKDGTPYDSQAPPGQIPGTLMTESDADEFDKTGS